MGIFWRHCKMLGICLFSHSFRVWKGWSFTFYIPSFARGFVWWKFTFSVIRGRIALLSFIFGFVVWLILRWVDWLTLKFWWWVLLWLSRKWVLFSCPIGYIWGWRWYCPGYDCLFSNLGCCQPLFRVLFYLGYLNMGIWIPILRFLIEVLVFIERWILPVLLVLIEACFIASAVTR